MLLRRSTETIAREVLEGLCADLMDLAANDNHLAAWHAARATSQQIAETVDQVVRTIEARNYERTQLAGLSPMNRVITKTLWNGGAA